MLQLDGIEWRVTELGSQTILLEPLVVEGHLEYIHRLFRFLENEEVLPITDLVPAYKSIALFYSSSKNVILDYLQKTDLITSTIKVPKIIEVEVNYSYGLDWDRVCKHTGLSKSEIIERHSKPKYTVAMIGFVPGFIFLEGLQTELTVPRLENPSTKIPAGSVGIGGNQTGIYSLESPGGWNIIGRTINQFFDVCKNPPSSISPGDALKFIPILK